MLYIFELDQKLYVSNLDPDALTDITNIMMESIEVKVPNAGKMPNSIQAGIIRNVLSAGGAQVIMR